MLQIHHGNRLEDLAARLAAVTAEPLDEPLAAECLIVQHQGMARWLSQQLAGYRGVAANLEFPFPAAFVWRVFVASLGASGERSAFDRDALLWRLMAALPGLLDENAFAPLRHYLRGDGDGGGDPLRGYQLCQRIADAFDQYLVYRPEMLLDWERGQAQPGDDWQPQLWRALLAEPSMASAAQHRARLFREFAQRADAGLLDDPALLARLPQRLCLFGLSALAPAYLEVFARLARHIEIHLFALNPCLHYWGDLLSERSQARLRALWQRHGKPDPGPAAYYESGNPLLASLGAAGRDFHELLQMHQVEEHDAFAAPLGDALLQQLQRDILLLESRDGAPVALPAGDRSIQLHSCHSAMREVQVLHDRLLAMFAADATLAPREVVVMAADIDRYAPFVDAVFGAAPPAQRIPWSLADRSLRAEQPLAAAFLQLLDLPGSRLPASEVLALLEVPAVLRRFGIDERDLPQLRSWIADAGVRWGLDGASRAELGLPADASNSWQFGLDRLLLGYAMPAAESTFAGLLPAAGPEGLRAALLGQLAGFLDRLRQLRRGLDRPRDAAAWQLQLNALLDLLFAADEADEALLAGLRQAIEALRESCARGGYHGELELAVVREHLRGALSQPAPRQRFLGGQVSFCNMVPMRSLPFRVVCLLGLNDAEGGGFPRQQRATGFDLIAKNPRRGDRRLRDDDRYLFLEAIISARDCLYLSWVGRDLRDNAERPPSVLIGELCDALERGWTAADGGPVAAQLITQHPLAPFSPRHFDPADPRRQSFAAGWLPPVGAAPRGRFAGRPLAAAQQREDLALDALMRFYEHPSRAFLQDRLGVWLDERDDSVEDSERFDLDGLAAWPLKQQALRQQLAVGAVDDGLQTALSLARAAGELPAGAVGELAWHEQIDKLAPMAAALRERTGEQRRVVEIDLDIALDGGAARLRGWLPLAEGGYFEFAPAQFSGKQALRLWLAHLALCAAEQIGAGQASCFFAQNQRLALAPLPAAAAREQLAAALEGWRLGQCAPLALFPKAALAYAQAAPGGPEKAMNAARRVWQAAWAGGRQTIPGEGDDPYNRAAFRGIDDPLAEDSPGGGFEHWAERLFGPLLAQRDDAEKNYPGA